MWGKNKRRHSDYFGYVFFYSRIKKSVLYVMLVEKKSLVPQIKRLGLCVGPAGSLQKLPSPFLPLLLMPGWVCRAAEGSTLSTRMHFHVYLFS